MINNDKFNFGVALDIDEETFDKAVKGSKSDRYKNMIIYGLASDDSEDTDSQTLYPSGYDFSYFLSNGLINLDHFTTRKGDSKYWVGEPLDANVKGEQFFVKAKLWEKSELARNFYDKVVEMKESGSNRKPGFSIEGKSIEKDPFNKNKILKAKILNCAITMTPVNTNSWLDIVKGVNNDVAVADNIETAIKEPYLFQYTTEEGYVVTVNKDLSIRIDKFTDINKTMDTSSIKPLAVESLDKRLKNLEQAKEILKSIEMNKIDRNLGKEIVKKIFDL